VSSSGTTGRPGWVPGCLILAGAALAFFLLILFMGSFVGRSSKGIDLSLSRRVGLIELRGVIDDAKPFLEVLLDLQDDPRVAALVVRIDSPGGDVGATQEIYHALQTFREKTGRPVVASLGSIAASGGYYAACGTQKIMAEPGTLTGSIGVILEMPDASELMAKIGLRMKVIKSGAQKDFGSYWRPLTPQEQAMLTGVVMDTYDQFVGAVAHGRGMGEEKVRALADGRIFTGRQACTEGLVDTLGFQPDAVRMAAVMAGLSPETPTLSRHRFEPEILGLIRRLGGQTRSWLASSVRLEYR
jgi:protease IV